MHILYIYTSWSLFYAKKEAPAVGTFGAVQELRYFHYII